MHEEALSRVRPESNRRGFWKVAVNSLDRRGQVPYITRAFAMMGRGEKGQTDITGA